LRLATIEDSDFLFAMRTYPEAARQSSGKPPTLEEHAEWIASSLMSPSRRILVAEENDDLVGTGRLDNHGEEVEVSWTVSPDYRGRGYGRQVIVELLGYAETVWPGVRCVAQIKPENVASLRAAFAAGFRLTGKTLLRLEA
jgi:RimJ/RimL family protein N-acetyltransferase